MKNISPLRIFYGILCLVAGISFPYYITIALVLVGFVLFDEFIEGIIAMIISDVVFGVPLLHFHSKVYIGTVFAFVSFALTTYIKSLTRFHEYF